MYVTFIFTCRGSPSTLELMQPDELKVGGGYPEDLEENGETYVNSLLFTEYPVSDTIYISMIVS